MYRDRINLHWIQGIKKKYTQNIGIRIDSSLSYTPFISREYDKSDTILNPYNASLQQKDTQQIQTHAWNGFNWITWMPPHV